MGLEFDRHQELKGIDEKIFESSERRYTRASLLALSETELCKRLPAGGFDPCVSQGLRQLEAEDTDDSWERLADPPANASGRTEGDSLLGPIERPNSRYGILPRVNASGRTESDSPLGPIERPDSRYGILPPVNASGRTESASLLGPIERPNSRRKILPPVNASGRTESDLPLGPIERPKSRHGILRPVNTSGRTDSASLLGPIERPNARRKILPPVKDSRRTESESLLGLIERPNSRQGILPPASALLPPSPCPLPIPPGFCGLFENPTPCPNGENKPQINSNTDAPRLKGEVVDQSIQQTPETGFCQLRKSANPYCPPHHLNCDDLCICLPDAPQLKGEVVDQSIQETLETGFCLLRKSANPYRPPHHREAKLKLDGKLESDSGCSPNLQIGALEIQSVNLKARDDRNLVSSPGQTASDDCPERVDCSRPCEPPFVDALTPSSDAVISACRANHTGIVFGDLGEFVCHTELLDMKDNELDFEDVWTEVSAKMQFEQEMELKHGAEHDDRTTQDGKVAGSEDEKCLPEDNYDDHSSAVSDAIISLPDEDSLISFDDLLTPDTSSLKDRKENSVKGETSKPKPNLKQKGARRSIMDDIACFKRRSGPALPFPLLLPHQIFQRSGPGLPFPLLLPHQIYHGTYMYSPFE